MLCLEKKDLDEIWQLEFRERLKSMTELKEQGHKLLTSFSKKDINSLKEKKIFLKILMPHQYHTIAKECCLFFYRLSYKPLCKVKTETIFCHTEG